jgi:mevalonate kinase
MLLAAVIFLAVTLALFVGMRYKGARSRSEVDLNELRDDVDGLLKREATRLARERSALRRNIEVAGDAAADITGAGGGGALGGVVRKEISAIPIARTGRRA